MHMYYGYHFMGMHLVWWFIWIVFMSIIFGWYTPVPKNRMRKEQKPPSTHQHQ